MKSNANHPAPPLATVHAFSAAHGSSHEPGRPGAGPGTGAGGPGQFRGALFKPANAAARLALQPRGRSNPAKVRGKLAQRGDGEWGAADTDEADMLGAGAMDCAGTGNHDGDESGSDEERQQEHRFAATNFAARSGAAASTALTAVPDWAHAAVSQGGIHDLLMQFTQRLMHLIDTLPKAPDAAAGPLHHRILRNVAAVLHAAGERSLDMGGWPGVCAMLRDASGTRPGRSGPLSALGRRLNLMLPLLLYHMTRVRTPAQRRLLMDRIDLACRSPFALREVPHEP